MDGFERSLIVAGLIAVVGAIVAFALVRPHDRDEPSAERAPTSELAA
jgi:hypothetical protein